MPSIERRERDGRLSWRAHYRTPEGRQRNKTFTRKIDAERFLTSVEASKLAGGFVDPVRARVTVGSLAERWIASKVNLKASTRARYVAALEDHVLPRWEDVTLAQVEHEAVQAWVAELVGSGGQSGASVRKIHGVLSSVLDLGVRSKRLATNPARGVTLPRAAVRSKRYLTAEQVEVMALAASTLPADRPRRTTDTAFEQYRLVVLVLSYCGLRWSELAALRVGAVDVKRRRLTVSAAVVEVDGEGLVWGSPKSHETRWVPIEPSIADDLGEYVAGRDPGELLFTAPDGGVLRNRNARRAWFNRAAADAGADGLTPHGLRHTAASLAVSAGANVLAVQRMLGHASAAITLDVYADLFPDDLEAVGERLSAVRARARVARALPDGSVVALPSSG
jgi:integrase